jgi:hypothetical protein
MRLSSCWFAMVAVAQICYASDSEVDRQTLAGITAVKVVIEDLPPDALNLGLIRESIQTDVELKLRLAGMRIVTFGSTYLYVNVNLSLDARASSVHVELNQMVTLLRDPTVMIQEPTWSVGSVTSNADAQFIRDTLKGHVDAFLNAWHSVNPKRSPSQN